MKRALAGVAACLAVVVSGACGPQASDTSGHAPVNTCPAFECSRYQGFSSTMPPASCTGGVCVVSAPLSYTLVVSLAATSYYAPGSTFALPSNELFARSGEGCPARTCVRLPGLADVSGIYHPAPTVEQNDVKFNLGNGPLSAALPIRASFRPVVQTGKDQVTELYKLGVPLAPIFADRQSAPLVTIRGPYGTAPIGFHAVIPAGLYERTLTVDPPFDRAYPPEIKVVEIAEGKTFDTIPLASVELTPKASGGVEFPHFTLSREGGNLDEWTVFLRDKTTQRRISSIATIAQDKIPNAPPTDVRLNTNHNAPDKDALYNAELVIEPPTWSASTPTMFFSKQGGQPITTLEYPDVPMPAYVKGTVTSEGDSVGVAAEIVLSSRRLERTNSTNATDLRFSTRLHTDVDGVYSAHLPRGEYDVVVIPSDPKFAKRMPPPLVVDARVDRQEGKTFQVQKKRRVSGFCRVADGRPLAFAEVYAAPAAALLARADREITWPRGAYAHTDADGRYALDLEPGLYDLYIQPGRGSRLPWLVTPNREVSTADIELEPLMVPAPVNASLRIIDPQRNPIIRAVVRAYAVPEGGTVALEIGRALTDERGEFEMFLAGSPR